MARWRDAKKGKINKQNKVEKEVTEEEYLKALASYQQRERRFGKV